MRGKGKGARPQGRPKGGFAPGKPAGGRPAGGRPATGKPPGDRPSGDRPPGERPAGRGRRESDGAEGWLFGRHAVEAALANPQRRLKRLLLSEAPDAALAALLGELAVELLPEIVGRAQLEQVLPPGAVHQGLALRADPLPQPSLQEFLTELGDRPAVVVALDHVTDPHNVGAILRSAAAFGAAAVLVTTDHAPPEGGTLAKAASGGLELVPYLRETNLARALELLKQDGFWCYGLDEAGEHLLSAAEAGSRSVIVLGAEGEGLRRLTRERCDLLVRLPTRPPIAALNVSNAAAVALYELTRPR